MALKDHMQDYFELLQSHQRVSDETTEAAHSALRLHDERQVYKILKKGTEQHAKNQHKFTVSFNAKNLGDF